MTIKKKLFKHPVPPYYIFLLQVYALGILFFYIFRCILILQNIEYLSNIEPAVIFRSLICLGASYDGVVCALILGVPFLLISFSFLSNLFIKQTFRISFKIVMILFTVAFALCACDIPYYNYYNSRINLSIFSWTDDIPSMLNAMVSTPEYLFSIILFLLISVLFNYLVWRLSKNKEKITLEKSALYYRVPVFLLFLVLLFFGIRGRLNTSRHPLIIYDAFCTEHTVLNQITLNGAHNFLYTIISEGIHFINTKEAIENAKKYLYISEIEKESIARKIEHEGKSQRANVVIVLMESMSSEKVGWYKKEVCFTPNIDSLINQSLFFPNTYTAGIHTYNGIFSTLFSLPAMPRNKQTLSSSYVGANFAGIPNILKREGYETMYFGNGSLKFDNLKAFLSKNGFDKLVGSESYSENELINLWGAGDHVVFNYSIRYLDSIAHLGKPFLAVFSTVSAHPPYDLPKCKGFTPTATTKVDRIYEYSDWCIGKFMHDISWKEWFDSTIFVFVADHGQKFNVKYEMPLSYHHVPLFFYYPSQIQPRVDNRLSLQMDIFPTIMGILKIPYTNNTMGIDLTKHERAFAYFSADDKIGCLNDKYFMIYKSKSEVYLFAYKNENLKNYASEEPELVNEMKTYTFSMLQTTQYLLNKKQTGF